MVSDRLRLDRFRANPLGDRTRHRPIGKRYRAATAERARESAMGAPTGPGGIGPVGVLLLLRSDCGLLLLLLGGLFVRKHRLFGLRRRMERVRRVLHQLHQRVQLGVSSGDEIRTLCRFGGRLLPIPLDWERLRSPGTDGALVVLVRPWPVFDRRPDVGRRSSIERPPRRRREGEPRGKGNRAVGHLPGRSRHRSGRAGSRCKTSGGRLSERRWPVSAM